MSAGPVDDPLRGMLRELTERVDFYMKDLPVGTAGTHNYIAAEIPSSEMDVMTADDLWLRYALPAIMDLQREAAGRPLMAVNLDKTVTVGTGKVQDATPHVRISLAKEGNVHKMSFDTFF